MPSRTEYPLPFEEAQRLLAAMLLDHDEELNAAIERRRLGQGELTYHLPFNEHFTEAVASYCRRAGIQVDLHLFFPVVVVRPDEFIAWLAFESRRMPAIAKEVEHG